MILVLILCGCMIFFLGMSIGTTLKKSSIVGKTSKYKGVARVSTNRFRTEIAHIVIGLFENERYAAMCYDLWAKDMYGEFAKLNFN